MPDISEVIATAVLAVPGVADLHSGSFGQVASYLPGRSVTGVRVRPDVTDIHVVLFWGVPVLEAAERVRTAVVPLIEGVSARIDVTVEDVIGREPGGPGTSIALPADPGTRPATP
ncbi:hypothetical protein GCM10022223_18140 [Kineosporia mesophila]|uniref:Asp23/Gls24 family envelope stress response protein n=1 Tax=Kineosporia mesophila TaxID=566012 RepID=A0ABP6ZBS2_9ACTN|nr:hypothetical protein [Kineosporia mesophila]MCD5351949.1 hypothetical protein [Kineosporia mesophila]